MNSIDNHSVPVSRSRCLTPAPTVFAGRRATREVATRASWQCIRLRVVRPSDEAALQQMYARCSESTQTHRFHGLLRELPSAYLAEVLTQPAGVHDGVVAELCSLPSTPHPPHMIALASLHTSEENGNATGEIGLLVEDAWQRRGLGRLLLSSLVSRAHARGLRRVQADILNQDWRLRSALARTLPTIKAAASRSSTTTVFEIGTELSAARTLPMCLLLADRGRQSEVPLTRSEW